MASTPAASSPVNRCFIAHPTPPNSRCSSSSNISANAAPPGSTARSPPRTWPPSAHARFRGIGFWTCWRQSKPRDDCCSKCPSGVEFVPMRDTEQLVAEVLDLPEQDRAEVAARILESLEETQDADVDEAWARELERRGAAVDSGQVVTSDWNVLRRRIEREIF